MKLRKGSNVRIKRTNQVGTIADIELIRKNGMIHKYCHIITEDKPELRLDSSELTDIHECINVTFTNDSGNQLSLEFDFNHKTNSANINITGKNPDNLVEHKGLHTWLLELLLQQLAQV